MNPSKEHQRYVNSVFTSGSTIAHSVVARAVLKGDLPDVKTLVCVDCGSPATCYDHRDYSYPLAGDPVCRSCNSSRGKATPKVWNSKSEFMDYMNNCKSVKWQVDRHGFDIDTHATPLFRHLIWPELAEKAAA